MQKAKRAIPEGYNTITTYLAFNGSCKEAIGFYKAAFDAVVDGEVMEAPDGRVLHTMIQIGDSNVMMSDNFEPERAEVGNAAHLWLYVDDCDTVFNRAVKAGAKVTMAMEDQFWGDRLGQVQDPFGFRWSIATLKWDLTDEEIEQKQKEWLESL